MWYRLRASDKDRVKRPLSPLSSPYFGQQRTFTRRTLKMKLSRIDSWKRWICFHLVTLQSWCYQAFSESHRHLLNLAFIIATKCQCEIEWKERNVVMQSLLPFSHPHDQDISKLDNGYDNNYQLIIEIFSGLLIINLATAPMDNRCSYW